MEFMVWVILSVEEEEWSRFVGRKEIEKRKLYFFFGFRGDYQ